MIVENASMISKVSLISVIYNFITFLNIYIKNDIQFKADEIIFNIYFAK
jgi:hypothetical protein